MFEDAYDLGFEHGKKGTYLCDRNNPFPCSDESHDEWETSYSDGFKNGEHYAAINKDEE